MRHNLYRWHSLSNEAAGLSLCGIIVLLVALLAGCGVTPGTGASSPTGTAASQTATASASATMGGTAAVANQVTITLDKQQYAPSNTITVTITNHLSTAIFVSDHQTNCTIVTLQFLNASNWNTMHNCRIMTPTRLVKLDAGSTHTIQLIPGGGQMSITPWAAGSYRAIMNYGTGATQNPAAGTMAASATFTVS